MAETSEKRFWCSFWAGDGSDMRPIYTTVPPDFHWWCSGEREQNPPHSICCVIDSESEAAAYSVARKFWPELEERFCEPKAPGFMPESTRFAVERSGRGR